MLCAEGSHSVGVERIVAEAQVARAAFCRRFPGKEDLVVAYRDEADRALRARARAAVAAGLPAADTLRAIGAAIAHDIRSPGFRGCAFFTPSAEYPDADHPVHLAVLGTASGSSAPSRRLWPRPRSGSLRPKPPPATS